MPWQGDQPVYDVSMLAATNLEANWLTYLVFESPGWALVVLALVWMALRVGGRRSGNKRLVHLSWIPLALVGVLIATSMLVTTKREQLLETQEQMLLAVEAGDYPAFRQAVAEDAEALFPPGRSAQTFTRDGMEAQLDQADIGDLLLMGSQAAMINEDTAVTVIRVRARGDYAGVMGVQVTQWSIQWRYADGRWRAYAFECIKIGVDALLNQD